MDQQLQDLIQQLKELTQTLKPLSGTTGTSGMGDKQVNKLVTALGILSTQLDKSSKKYQNQAKALDAFTKKVDENADKIEKEAAARAAAAAAIKKEAEAREESVDATSKLFNKERLDSIKQRQFESRQKKVTLNDLRELGIGSTFLNENFKGLADRGVAFETSLAALSKISRGVADSFKSMAGSLNAADFSTKSAVSATNKFGKSLTDSLSLVGDAVSAAAIFLGPSGWLLKGAVFLGGQLLKLGGSVGGLALELQEVGAKQLDDLLGSFRVLSSYGIGLERGVSEVRDLAQTTGMTVGQIEMLNKVLAENSQNLARMGLAAGKGATAFAKVAGSLFKSNLGYQLELMGVRQEEQAELTMTYMNILAKTGQLQVKNNQQIEQTTKNSAEFSKEMAMISNLTGIQRKELAKAVEAQLNDTRFRAAQSQAIKEGNKQRIQEIKTAQELAAVFESLGDPDMARGIRTLAATGGMPIGEEAVAAMQSGMYEAIQTGDFFKAMQSVGKTMPQFLANIEPILAVTGDIKTFTTKGAKMYDVAAMITQAQADADKQGITLRAALEKLIKNQVENTDTETKNLVDGEQDRKAAALIQDRAIEKLNFAADIQKKSSEVFRDAIDKFSNLIGATDVTGGNISRGGGGFFPAAGGPLVPSKDGLGGISARWESGSRASEAIGWDVRGGTSYGKYQLSAKKGTMDAFIKYLEQQGHTEMAGKLRAAGSAETGGTGGKMPEVWKELARSGQLKNLEHEFIKSSHYDPAFRSLKPELQKMIKDNPALQEMLWSTSVQHGPSGKAYSGGAGDIFNRAFKAGVTPEQLVESVYADRSTRFGGSSQRDRENIQRIRFPQEKAAILDMLKKPPALETPGAPASTVTTPVAPAVPMSSPVGGPGNPLESVQSPLSSTANTLRETMQTLASADRYSATGAGSGDPATHDLLGQLVSLTKEQSNGINRLIQSMTG